MFRLNVRATSGSPVGLRSAGKGTVVEFSRFLALNKKMKFCLICLDITFMIKILSYIQNTINRNERTYLFEVHVLHRILLETCNGKEWRENCTPKPRF